MPSTIIDRIDGVTTSAAVKVPVTVVANSPLTLSGVQTIDGVTLTAYSGPGLPADRILVNGQADTTTNGIYLCQTGAWTREPDFNGPRDAVTGTIVEVRSGTLYANSFWKLTTTDNPIIIGTSHITFAQFNFYQFANGTSSSSNAIGTGAKTFVTQSGLSFQAGQFLVISDSANSANYMHGTVTSYSGTSLVMNILDVGGSGTKTSWNISISAPSGPTGATGAAGSNGTNGTNAATQINNFRLSASTGVAVPNTDITAAATLYLTPYNGNQIGLYDGSSTWTAISSAEISIAVPATTSTMYDVFCYNNSGTPTLELLAWTNDTTRATALVLQNGILVKSGATTRRYVGSFRTTGTSGQTEDSKLKRFVWNNNNRILRPMYFRDSTANWTYTTATIRQANANTAAQLAFVRGLNEDLVNSTYSIQCSNSSTDVALNGLGLDSITAMATGSITAGGQQNDNTTNIALYNDYPSAGYHYIAALEVSQAAGTTTWYNTGAFGSGPPNIQCGMTGSILG